MTPLLQLAPTRPHTSLKANTPISQIGLTGDNLLRFHNYTPGQLRDAVAVPQETYRHWKKVLTPLRRDTRRSPCFTVGDLLAVELVRTMTGFPIRGGAISAITEELLRICNDTSWPSSNAAC